MENKKDILEVLPSEYFDNYLREAKEYGYKSLVLGVIDSVFSISAKYESTFKTVERFASYTGIDLYNQEFLVSDFIGQYSEYSDIKLAEEVFRNRQRTSTSNGILKAQAVKEFINILDQHNIQTKEDLLKYPNKKDLKQKIAQIKGQKSGITFEYLMMLAGDTERFKPDRHIYRFFEEYLNYGKLDEYKLNIAFKEQLITVQNKYERFTIRMLDNLIWKFVRDREERFTEKEPIKITQPYFMTNSKWFYFDNITNKFYLTSAAPKEAKESYELFYDAAKK